MESAILDFVALQLFVAGLSHAIQHRAWAEFFIHLREKGRVGVFIIALMHLPLGAFIVAFHRVWHGLPLIVTLLGWAWTLKGTLYLIQPEIGLWALSHVSLDRSRHFVMAGVVLIAISLVLFWNSHLRGG